MRRSFLYAWWYLSISLGFVALAARDFVGGSITMGTALRIVIAAGFALLSYFTFRQLRRER